MRLKKCGVAVNKNFAMCGVYIILHAVYGEVKEFCRFTNSDPEKVFLFMGLMKKCSDCVLLNFCVVLQW